jgi:hypothetical protein
VKINLNSIQLDFNQLVNKVVFTLIKSERNYIRLVIPGWSLTWLYWAEVLVVGGDCLAGDEGRPFSSLTQPVFPLKASSIYYMKILFNFYKIRHLFSPILTQTSTCIKNQLNLLFEDIFLTFYKIRQLCNQNCMFI